MERINLDKDLRIMCVTARSFPDGIQDAFMELEKRAGNAICDRPFFGLSHPNREGTILYRAGVLVEEEGEAERFGFDLIVLPKGEYLTKMILDWKKKVSLIGQTFQKLIHHPDLDPEAFCIEWYKGENDVLCMVKAKEEKWA